jgi:serine/threonine protein kinase
MQALKLIRQLNCQFMPMIGKEIGFGGADGEVFDIQDDNARVIKCAVIYEYLIPLNKEMERIETVARHLIETQPHEYVRVHTFERVAESSRKTVSGEQKYFLYYYIMDKCFKISEDEKKVFHSILSNEDRNLKKNYPLSKIETMLKGMSMGLDFDMKKVLSFCKEIQNSKIDNTDINPRNIMKNANGDFKLIDFDRSSMV